MLSVAHAVDLWRQVHLHAEPPDWIRLSVSSPYLLQTHRADLCYLLQQDGASRPPATILALIDGGSVARLWCLLKSRPALATLPLHNAPFAYPLHAAADGQSGDSCTAVARLLLSFRAQVDGRDDDGETALHRAAYYYPGMVRLLIQSGACVNARSKFGALPMHYAAQSGQPGVLQHSGQPGVL